MGEFSTRAVIEERLTAVGAAAFTVNECCVTESAVAALVKLDTTPLHVPLGALKGIGHEP